MAQLGGGATKVQQVAKAEMSKGTAVIDQPHIFIEGSAHLGFCTPSLRIDESAFDLLRNRAAHIRGRVETQRRYRGLDGVGKTNALINLAILETRRRFVHTGYERYERAARRHLGKSDVWTLSQAMATRTGDCRLHAIVLAILLGPAGLAIPRSRFVYIECRDAPVVGGSSTGPRWLPVEDHGIVVFEIGGRSFIADAFSRYYDRVGYDPLARGEVVVNSGVNRLGASLPRAAGRPTWPWLSLQGQHGARRFRYLRDSPRHLQVTRSYEGVFPLISKPAPQGVTTS